MQKPSRRADDLEMSRTTRRSSLLASVLAATLGFGLVACGADEVSLSASGDDQTETTDVADAPDREDVDAELPTVDDQAGDDQAVDDAVFDDAETLFSSVIGSNYVLTFELISQVSAGAGPITVEVINGQAASVTYPDAMTEQILPQIPLLTVTDFFARARSVLADGGVVEVEFDEASGYPLRMTFDPIPAAIDDEMSIVVQSVDITDS